MKLLTDKGIIKKIIIVILIVMSFNFISPTISQADFGGMLFKPISQLLTVIGDLVIKGLQSYFMGDGDIDVEDPTVEGGTSYYIEYSPGMIFSNKVAGLDVNFFKPGDGYQKTEEVSSIKTIDESTKTNTFGATDEEIKAFKEELFAKHPEVGYDPNKAVEFNNYDTNTAIIFGEDAEVWTWNHNGKKYFYVYKVNTRMGIGAVAPKHEYTFTIAEENTSTSIAGEKIESSASQLQSTVATWYKALRAIALVGLLSVLVYVGIRILISSTGQEKAKYKKMIMDWLTAMCILFILQYIMIFTLEITQKITDVLSVNIIGENGQDKLMSDLRFKVGDPNSVDFSQIFPHLLMYLALVIHTVMFTFQYLKRLLYMAFFTLIAPLIALTYPIDKIKDGQAQAFTTWIREYIFNALLQPMHLLLYYIFVSSATSLVEKNPLYAVVAIGFLVPAEKFFRKMFGFEKAESSSQMGAAAGGALIMNAINSMGHMGGGKHSSGGSKASSGGSSGGTASGSSAGVRTSSSNAGNIGTGGDSSGSGGTPGNLGTARNANRFGPTMGTALGKNRSIRNGVSAVRRKYLNKNTAKKAGALARRGVLGAAGAAALGTVGLAAGLSTGDFGNAAKYGLAGATAGYMGANSLGDSVLAGEKSLRETFKEGAIGQNEYNNLKADKAFYESDEFRSMLNNHDLLPGEKGRTAKIRNAVQVYRDNGITDTKKITTAMKISQKNNLSPAEGAYAIKLAQMIGQSGWNNPTTRKDFEARYKSKIPGTNGDKIWNSIESLL